MSFITKSQTRFRRKYLLVSFLNPPLSVSSMTTIAGKLFVRLTTFSSRPRLPSRKMDDPFHIFSYVYIYIYIPPVRNKAKWKDSSDALTSAYVCILSRARVSLLRYIRLSVAGGTISIDWKTHEQPSHLSPFFRPATAQKRQEFLLKSTNKFFEYTSHHELFDRFIVNVFPYARAYSVFHVHI